MYQKNVTRSWIEYLAKLLEEKLNVGGRNCSVGEAMPKIN
jgi:hypothetical protein